MALTHVNVAAYLLNFITTYASQFVLPKYGGKTNGEVSHEYTSIVTPAGYAFTIWSVIFLGEAAFTVWQARSRCDRAKISPLDDVAGTARAA